MIDTKTKLSTNHQTSARTADARPARTHARPLRLRPSLRPHTEEAAHTNVASPSVSRRKQVWHFAWHYGEMCAPMCIGFAVGDLVYFWVAGMAGYSKPFSQLPELSVLVVTFSMTAPMTAWMLFRGMPRRETAEMSAVMPILAIVLLAFGWLGIMPKSALALLEHGLMMPAMLIPMFLRLKFYTGRTDHGRGTAQAAGRRDAP